MVAGLGRKGPLPSSSEDFSKEAEMTKAKFITTTLLAVLGLFCFAATVILAERQVNIPLATGKLITLLAAKKIAPSSEPRPDLYIQQATPISTANQQIRVQIANCGTATAPASTLLVTYTQNGLIRQQTIFVPVIPAGSSRWLIIDLEATIPALAPIRLLIDKDNRVPESDERNNQVVVNSFPAETAAEYSSHSSVE